MIMTVSAEEARKVVLNEGFRPKDAFVADGFCRCIVVFTALRGDNRVEQLRVRFNTPKERERWLNDFKHLLKPMEGENNGAQQAAQDALSDAAPAYGAIPCE